jgi:hypothetical protein
MSKWRLWPGRSRVALRFCICKLLLVDVEAVNTNVWLSPISVMDETIFIYTV